MDTLPYLALEKIVQHLTTQDLARCSAVCREWREVFNQDWIWKPHCDPELEAPLRTIPSVATPKFVTPEEENSTLALICDWRLAYMRETHLWNNWRKGDFSKVNKMEIDKNIYSIDFLTDTLIVVWYIGYIIIMDVSKKAVEIKAETNTLVNIRPGDICSVIDTTPTMLLVEKDYSVDIYNFDLAKKIITLKHSIPLAIPVRPAHRPFLSYNTVPDHNRLAKEKCYVFVDRERSNIKIFDLNSGQLLKEEPYPVKVIQSENLSFFKVQSSSTSNFVAVTFLYIVDRKERYEVYIYSIEHLTFLPDVVTDIFALRSDSVSTLHRHWLAYSEMNFFTVYNFETREVVLRHRLDYYVYDLCVWDNSFIFIEVNDLPGSKWLKFSPEQNVLTTIFINEHTQPIFQNIINKKVMIATNVEDNMQRLEKQYLWRQAGGMVMRLNMPQDRFCTSKVNKSLTRIIIKKLRHNSCVVHFSW